MTLSYNLKCAALTLGGACIASTIQSCKKKMLSYLLCNTAVLTLTQKINVLPKIHKFDTPSETF